MTMLEHAEVEEVGRWQPLLSVDAVHAAAVAAAHEESGQQQSAAEDARECERLQQVRVGVRVRRSRSGG